MFTAKNLSHKTYRIHSLLATLLLATPHLYSMKNPETLAPFITIFSQQESGNSDNTPLLTLVNDTTLVFQSPHSIEQIWDLPLPKQRSSIAGIPIPTSKASLNSRGTILIHHEDSSFTKAGTYWDLINNQALPARPNTLIALSSPDNSAIFTWFKNSTGSMKGTLWNAKRKCGRVLSGPECPLIGSSSIHFSKNNQWFLAKTAQGKILWDLESLKPADFITEPYDDCTMNDTGEWLFTTTPGETSLGHVWDLNKRTLMHTIDGHFSPIIFYRLSKKGDWLLTHSKEATYVCKPKERKLADFDPLTDSVHCHAEFSPESTFLFEAQENSHRAVVWNLALQAIVLEPTTEKDRSYDKPKFSPNDRWLYVTTRKNKGPNPAEQQSELWDMHTLLKTNFITGHKKDIYYVKFSKDGRLLFTLSDDAGYLWDLEKQELADFAKEYTNLTRAIFSKNGRWVIGQINDKVLVWDMQP